MKKHRIFTTSFASVYPHYVHKAEVKGRKRQDVDDVICWLTGYSPSALAEAPRVVVRKLGRSAVGTSWPRSESRLATPIPRTPGVSHAVPAVSSAVGSVSTVPP